MNYLIIFTEISFSPETLSMTIKITLEPSPSTHFQAKRPNLEPRFFFFLDRIKALLDVGLYQKLYKGLSRVKSGHHCYRVDLVIL